MSGRHLALRLLVGGLLLASALPASAQSASAETAAGKAQDRRLCALLPWVAEAFTANDDGVAVVAMVPRHLGLPVLPGAADLGNPHAPNLEVLAAARCDLLVADGRIHRALQPSLTGVAGELLWLDGGSIDATMASLEQVGVKLGASRVVEPQVAEVRKQLAALSRADGAEVLALFGAPGAWRVMTKQTWLGDLLVRLGFKNLGDVSGLQMLTPGFAALSDEVLLGFKPRVVLLVAHGDPDAVLTGFQRETTTRPAFRELADKAHALDPVLFGSNPGLSFPKLAEHLLALAGGQTAVARSAGP